MKRLKYLILAFAASLIAFSCAKPADEFIHDDCTISSIMMTSEKDKTTAPIEGTIDQETGEIIFTVPRDKYNAWDLTRVKVRATIGYDAYISPSLSGIKDLSEEYRITVTARQTGKSKDYTLLAKYARK